MEEGEEVRRGKSSRKRREFTFIISKVGVNGDECVAHEEDEGQDEMAGEDPGHCHYIASNT